MKEVSFKCLSLRQLSLQRDRRVWCLLIGWRRSALLLGWKWDALRGFYLSTPVALFVLLSRECKWLAGNWQGMSIFLVISFVSRTATDTNSPRLRQPGQSYRRMVNAETCKGTFQFLMNYRSWRYWGFSPTGCWVTKADWKITKQLFKDLAWGRCWDRKRSYKPNMEFMHPPFHHVMF